jgi:hypothetical protein
LSFFYFHYTTPRKPYTSSAHSKGTLKNNQKKIYIANIMLKLSRTRVQSIMCFLVVMFAALNCIQDFSAYTKEFDALGHDSRNERNLDIMHQEQGEDQPAASNSVFAIFLFLFDQ